MLTSTPDASRAAFSPDRCAPAATLAQESALGDLWDLRQRGRRFDLPPPFAQLRRSSPEDLSGVHLEALSADMPLTPNTRAGSVVTHEPGSDAKIHSRQRRVGYPARSSVTFTSRCPPRIIANESAWWKYAAPGGSMTGI